jgi:hypothetical protein
MPHGRDAVEKRHGSHMVPKWTGTGVPRRDFRSTGVYPEKKRAHQG